MNWYKRSQSDQYPMWFAEQMMKLTNNHQKDVQWAPLQKPENIQILKDWIYDTNPDLSKLDIFDAWKNAYSDHTNRKYKKNDDPYDLEEIKRNMNRFRATTQRINPKADDFAVDLRDKEKTIAANIRKKINNAIYDLGNFHNEIPLQNIFDICEQYDVIAIAEDGTKWSGFLMGGAECGSKEAENQHASFQLATKREDNQYVPSNYALQLTWCKMGSGRYEIVCYVG